MPGADAPAAARAVVESTRVSHHGHTGNTRHSPRNGFNGFLRALPGDRAFLPPSSAVARQLDTSVGASGPHDFAVRRPHRSSGVQPTSTASRPNVCDDRETPLSRAGTSMDINLIWVGGEAEYFCTKGWTDLWVICPPGSRIARRIRSRTRKPGRRIWHVRCPLVPQ
jgi:hypothetical protein